MSTPKRIREIYENAFKKAIRPTKHFLNLLKEPPQSLNLPIKLSEVRINLFTPSLAANPMSNLSKKKTTKPRARKSGKK